MSELPSNIRPESKFRRAVQQPWFWLVVFVILAFTLAHPAGLFFMLFVPSSILLVFGSGVSLLTIALAAIIYIVGFVLASRYIRKLSSAGARIVTSIGSLFLLSTLVDLIVWHRFQILLLFIDSVFGTTFG